MRSYVSACRKNLSVKAKTSKTSATARGTIRYLLIAIGLMLVWSLPSAVNATPVSITVDSGFQQRADADVTIKDSAGNVVKTGKTAVPSSGGRPKFTTDLAPGTYTIEASWLNRQGRTETGTMTYTVTAGNNVPNVAVADGGYQNPPGSGTSSTAGGASGSGASVVVPAATVGGARPASSPSNPFFMSDASAASYGSDPSHPSRLPFLLLALTSEYYSHNTAGVDTLPITNAGNLVTKDANTDGVRNEFKVGVGGNNVAGAKRFYTHVGVRHDTGTRKTTTDRVVAPAGADTPGIGGLNNQALVGNVDNIVTKSKISALMGFIGFGLVYSLGPIGNISLGSIGNMSGIPSNNSLIFSPSVQIHGGVREQTNKLSFINSGANVIQDELDIISTGIVFRFLLGLPITRYLQFGFRPEIGFDYNDSTADFRQQRAAAFGDAKAKDSNVSFSTGATASLTYQVAKGFSVGLQGSVRNEFDRPVAEVTRSNTDPSEIGHADDLSYGGGLKFVVRPAELFSDMRLKTNIVRIGVLPSGLPVYRYNYIWSAETHIGVIAQEAMQLFPEAVREVDGYLAVDYSRIR